jgi:hypothetical protein
MGRDEGNVNNVQYKSDWNCHYKSPPPYNEYILMKKFKIRKIVVNSYRGFL